MSLAGCADIVPKPRQPSSGHLGTSVSTPAPSRTGIPKPVRTSVFLPPPKPSQPEEIYTVVVNDVPVKELLFALARDAAINVDIDPNITGNITLNAVDQTLAQILERVSRQLDLRYTIRDQGVMVELDTPVLRTYRVDYVNLSRTSSSTNTVSTQIAGPTGTAASEGGAGADNSSETRVTSTSVNQFWDTLTSNIRNMLSGEPTLAGFAGGSEGRSFEPEQAVIPNPEAGVISVRATTRQHVWVQSYIDRVLLNSRRQVLIEATIVEVELSDSFQSGIDWGKLASSAGVAIQQSLLGGSLASAPFFLLQAADSRDATGAPNGDLSLTVRLLKEFGEARVLSSPKIMTLNNQTALLKVVDNVVYFEVEAEVAVGDTGPPVTSFETTPQTVAVGLVMAVTPQINDQDDVSITVRPTISRVSQFVNDPNPTLVAAGAVNAIPEIQVRELESVLRVGSGQLAVLGGLMQDSVNQDVDAVPILSESKSVGELFKNRDNEFSKTELVIFLRPWVIKTPDVRADLRDFAPFLPENISPGQSIKSKLGEALP